MLRRVRWIVLLLVVLLVAVAAAGALLVRPDLVDTRDRVDARWSALRADLTSRYAALAGVADALDAAGASDRAVTRELRRELLRWEGLRDRDPADPALEAAAANNLEALVRRAGANVIASDRLAGDVNVQAAFTALAQEVVSPPGVRAYNRAVRSYEAARDGTFERIVAKILGFESRPTLIVAPRA